MVAPYPAALLPTPMEWTEDTGLAKRILEDIAAELQQNQERYLERLPHLSELIYCLTASWYNRFKPLPHTQQETMLFSTGIGLETVLLRPHKKAATGELDGIFWSADLLDQVEGLGEMKSTRISVKNIPEKIPETWRRQMLAYMKATENYEISLVVLHLMGNYAPPFPQLRCWHGSASHNEIEANWQWLLQRKKVYLQYIADEAPPRQFTYNQPWECDNCRYKIICEANESIDTLRLKKHLGV